MSSALGNSVPTGFMSSLTSFGGKKQDTLETWKQHGQHSKLVDLNLNKGCYDTKKNIRHPLSTVVLLASKNGHDVAPNQSEEDDNAGCRVNMQDNNNTKPEWYNKMKYKSQAH